MAKFNFSFHLETEDQAEAVSFFAALSDALDTEMPDTEVQSGVSLVDSIGKKERKKREPKNDVTSPIADEHTDVSAIKNAMDSPLADVAPTAVTAPIQPGDMYPTSEAGAADLKKALVKTVQEKADAHPDNAAKMLGALEMYGAKRVSELKPEFYAEVLAKFQSL